VYYLGFCDRKSSEEFQRIYHEGKIFDTALVSFAQIFYRLMKCYLAAKIIIWELSQSQKAQIGSGWYPGQNVLITPVSKHLYIHFSK